MNRFKKSDLNELKRSELVAIAKEQKIKNYSRMKKNQLIKAILDWQDRLDETLARVQAEKPKEEKKNKMALSKKNLNSELKRQEDVHQERIDEHTDELKTTEAKFDLGKIKEFPVQKRIHDLPDHYSDNKIVLMVRDPQWLFSYWEMTEAYVEQKKKAFSLEDKPLRYVLRMYEYPSSHQGQAIGFMDFPLHGLTRKYYCQINHPGSYYQVEFGVIDGSGKYYGFLSSNTVRAPRNSMSDVVDEKWMTLADEQSFSELYQMSGGDIWKKRIGSEEMSVGRYDTTQILSSGVSSFVSSLERNDEKNRHFFIKLRAQVKLFGETMPDARLKIGDRMIELNEDGTFELEFDFPDGTIKLPIEVISPDEKECHHIETTFYHITRAEQTINEVGGGE